MSNPKYIPSTETSIISSYHTDHRDLEKFHQLNRVKSQIFSQHRDFERCFHLFLRTISDPHLVSSIYNLSFRRIAPIIATSIISPYRTDHRDFDYSTTSHFVHFTASPNHKAIKQISPSQTSQIANTFQTPLHR